MLNWWDVEQFDVEKLLATWRWLCPQKLTLLARNAFGDLFLQDDAGSVFCLNVSGGTFTKIASSYSQFVELAGQSEKREDWFAECDERTAAARGLTPRSDQCIGFEIPVVFAESASTNPYLIDIYENVGMLGDLHRQIAELPDGAKVELKIRPQT
ncbi:MAG: hypothetical protein WAK26_14035 [Terracidiphilus sp.]